MNTECSTEQLDFHGSGRRTVVGKFDISHPLNPDFPGGARVTTTGSYLQRAILVSRTM